MKALPAFDRFERGLRADSADVFGTKTSAKRPGRQRKEDSEPVVGMDAPWGTIKLPDELAQQVESIAQAAGLNRTGLARMIVAAGTEAVLRQIEADGKLSLPITFAITTEPLLNRYRDVRTVTPLRFEALRARHPWALPKWKGLHPGDKTGAPMPPPKSPAIKR